MRLLAVVFTANHTGVFTAINTLDEQWHPYLTMNAGRTSAKGVESFRLSATTYGLEKVL